MTFKELSEVLHPVLGEGEPLKYFIRSLISILMGDPEDEMISIPYYGKEGISSLEKIASGTRGLPQNQAKIILAGFQAHREYFISCLEGAKARFSSREDNDNASPFEEMLIRFQAYGVVIDETNVFESIADAVYNILWSYSNGKKDGYDFAHVPTRDWAGNKIHGVPVRHVTVHDGKLDVCGIQLDLSDKLTPPDEINLQEERPYVEALLEAYQSATESKLPLKVEDLKHLGEIGNRFARHLKMQRENFYDAETLLRQSRDLFYEGEEKFDSLKRTVKEGIEQTYYFDVFNNAFERVNGVLKQSTTISLENDELNQILNGITPKTKMGLCHELVNDGTIKSWELDDE